MPNEYINLWTIHSPNFSITDGRVDHSKSEYYQNTHGVKQAYPELWQRINIVDGQIIWCFPDKNDIRKTGKKLILWELYLPRSEVIQFVDDMVWNRILGIKCDIPMPLRCQWRNESLKNIPNNQKAAKDYEHKCYQEYWMQKPKTGNWWDELFVSGIGMQKPKTGNWWDELFVSGIGGSISTSVLIRHPVQLAWVKDKIKWYY
jgi:hypothetical protein